MIAYIEGLPPLKPGPVVISTDSRSVTFNQERRVYDVPARVEKPATIEVSSSKNISIVNGQLLVTGACLTNKRVKHAPIDTPQLVLDRCQIQTINGRITPLIHKKPRPDMTGLYFSVSGGIFRAAAGDSFTGAEYRSEFNGGLDVSTTIELEDWEEIAASDSDIFSFNFKDDGSIDVIFDLGRTYIQTKPQRFPFPTDWLEVIDRPSHWAPIKIDELRHGLPGPYGKLRLSPGMPVNIRNQKGTEIINVPTKYQGPKLQVGFDPVRLERCLRVFDGCDSIHLGINGPEDTIKLDNGELRAFLAPVRQKWN